MRVGILKSLVLGTTLAGTSLAVPTAVQAEEDGSTIRRYVEEMDRGLQGLIVGAGSVGLVVLSNMTRKKVQEIYRQAEEDAIKQKQTETDYNGEL